MILNRGTETLSVGLSGRTALVFEAFPRLAVCESTTPWKQNAPTRPLFKMFKTNFIVLLLKGNQKMMSELL